MESSDRHSSGDDASSSIAVSASGSSSEQVSWTVDGDDRIVDGDDRIVLTCLTLTNLRREMKQDSVRQLFLIFTQTTMYTSEWFERVMRSWWTLVFTQLTVLILVFFAEFNYWDSPALAWLCMVWATLIFVAQFVRQDRGLFLAVHSCFQTWYLYGQWIVNMGGTYMLFNLLGVSAQVLIVEKIIGFYLVVAIACFDTVKFPASVKLVLVCLFTLSNLLGLVLIRGLQEKNGGVDSTECERRQGIFPSFYQDGGSFNVLKWNINGFSLLLGSYINSCAVCFKIIFYLLREPDRLVTLDLHTYRKHCTEEVKEEAFRLHLEHNMWEAWQEAHGTEEEWMMALGFQEKTESSSAVSASTSASSASSPSEDAVGSSVELGEMTATMTAAVIPALFADSAHAEEDHLHQHVEGCSSCCGGISWSPCCDMSWPSWSDVIDFVTLQRVWVEKRPPHWAVGLHLSPWIRHVRFLEQEKDEILDYKGNFFENRRREDSSIFTCRHESAVLFSPRVTAHPSIEAEMAATTAPSSPSSSSASLSPSSSLPHLVRPLTLTLPEDAQVLEPGSKQRGAHLCVFLPHESIWGTDALRQLAFSRQARVFIALYTVYICTLTFSPSTRSYVTYSIELALMPVIILVGLTLSDRHLMSHMLLTSFDFLFTAANVVAFVVANLVLEVGNDGNSDVFLPRPSSEPFMHAVGSMNILVIVLTIISIDVMGLGLRFRSFVLVVSLLWWIFQILQKDLCQPPYKDGYKALVLVKPIVRAMDIMYTAMINSVIFFSKGVYFQLMKPHQMFVGRAPLY